MTNVVAITAAAAELGGKLGEASSLSRPPLLPRRPRCLLTLPAIPTAS